MELGRVEEAAHCYRTSTELVPCPYNLSILAQLELQFDPPDAVNAVIHVGGALELFPEDEEVSIVEAAQDLLAQAEALLAE